MKLLLVEFETHYPHLQKLKKELHEIFGYEIKVHKSLLHASNEYFNKRKSKWDAMGLLYQVRSEFENSREGKFMVFCLTPNDIFLDSLNFVYGLSEQNGNNAIISYFRLDEKFYGRQENIKLLEERVLKEAVHEIGHMNNLAHCSNKKCVMSFSPNIIFVDRKLPKFCKKCELFI